MVRGGLRMGAGDWEWESGGLGCRGEDLRGFSEDKSKGER